MRLRSKPMRINNAGTYRGRVLNAAVTTSKNGFPQFAMNLVADEYWDTDGEPAWVALQDKPEIDNYMVLVDSKEQKTLNCKQVETVFGWDGASLVDLDNLNLVEAKVQFRVETREYNNQQQIQVTWISEYDALPGRKVSKLEPDAVKALNAKFSKALGGKVSKPASAPAAAPKTPPQAPAAKPKAPKREPTKPVVPTTPGKCTMEEAFAYISNQELWKKDVDQKKVEDTWLTAITDVSGNKADSEITPEEWFKIREKVSQIVFVF
jgi:hypothetical protein